MITPNKKDIKNIPDILHLHCTSNKRENYPYMQLLKYYST